MAKAVGAWPRPWGGGQGHGAVSMAVTKAVGSGQGLGCVTKAVGATPRRWGRCQGRGAVSMAVGVWTKHWVVD